MQKAGIMYINNYHTGKRLQRGRGIGSIFGSILRSIVPIGKKILTSNVTKSIAKSIGSSLKDAAIDTALDVVEGRNLKESAQERLNETRGKIAKVIRSKTKKPKVKRHNNSKQQKINGKKAYYLLNKD